MKKNNDSSVIPTTTDARTNLNSENDQSLDSLLEETLDEFMLEDTFNEVFATDRQMMTVLIKIQEQAEKIQILSEHPDATPIEIERKMQKLSKKDMNVNGEPFDLSPNGQKALMIQLLAHLKSNATKQLYSLTHTVGIDTEDSEYKMAVQMGEQCIDVLTSFENLINATTPSESAVLDELVKQTQNMLADGLHLISNVAVNEGEDRAVQVLTQFVKQTNDMLNAAVEESRTGEGFKARQKSHFIAQGNLIIGTMEHLICPLKSQLYDAIDALRLYGEEMGTRDESTEKDRIKAAEVATLVAALKTEADNYFGSENANYNSFQTRFIGIIKANEDKMSSHRAAWKPILANILLACTIVGLVPMFIKAVHAIHQSHTQNKGISANRFFLFAQTEREKKVDTIEEALNSYVVVAAG